MTLSDAESRRGIGERGLAIGSPTLRRLGWASQDPVEEDLVRTVIPGATEPADLPIAMGVVASGRLLFISGQGPIDATTRSLISGSFKDQARLTLDNLASVAAAAGTDLTHAVKVNAYLRDMRNFGAFNEVYREYFSGDWPARTTVQSDLLGFEIEIDAIVDVDPSADTR